MTQNKGDSQPLAMQDQGFLDIGGQRLEYRMIGPRPDQAPTIVMLHEGLGSAGMWGDFPDRLAQATKAGVFVYSRAGYGKSSPAALPRSPRYMHDEACEVLPQILTAIGFRRGILLGHSDGASIAAIYAGSVQDHRVRGLALIAPNVMVEDESLKAVNAAKAAFAQGDLRARLARWHDDPDAVFRGWSEAWLNPAFRNWDILEELAYIRVPILIVRGTDDRHGTLRQVEAAQEECYCPVDLVEVEAQHAPHREAPEATLKAGADFINRILHGHEEAAFAA